MNLCQPTSLEVITEIENKLGIRFPSDYIEFMLFSNGCEGSIGQSYISTWPIEELIEANESCEVEKYTPGLVLFGSDGGGEAFAFDIAIVPSHLVYFYSELPSESIKQTIQDKHMYIRNEV